MTGWSWWTSTSIPSRAGLIFLSSQCALARWANSLTISALAPRKGWARPGHCGPSRVLRARRLEYQAHTGDGRQQKPGNSLEAGVRWLKMAWR